MDGACHQFFACAAGAGDQHRGSAGRNHFDEPEDLLHLARGSVQAPQRSRIPQAAACGLELGARAQQGGSVAQHRPQAIGVDGLSEVVVSTHSHGLHGTVDGPLGGDQDDGDRGGLFGEVAQQFESAHARHLEVGNDDRG